MAMFGWQNCTTCGINQQSSCWLMRFLRANSTVKQTNELTYPMNSMLVWNSICKKQSCPSHNDVWTSERKTSNFIFQRRSSINNSKFWFKNFRPKKSKKVKPKTLHQFSFQKMIDNWYFSLFLVYYFNFVFWMFFFAASNRGKPR